VPRDVGYFRSVEATMPEDRALLDRITVDPDVMVGTPVVRGTRVPVELVLGFLAASA
jgi:uncharacterized protein (DUF433 family)